MAAVQSAAPDLQHVNTSAGGVSTFTPENSLSLAGGNLEMLETQNEVFLFSKHTLMSAVRNKHYNAKDCVIPERFALS